MSERVHLLAQSILGKSNLEDCTLEETRDMAQRYPYFAPAQFLYLQKLRSLNHEEYLKQLQKAVLYYHNPLAFEYFISSDRFLTEIDLEKQDTVLPKDHIAPQPVEETNIQNEPVEKTGAIDQGIETGTSVDEVKTVHSDLTHQPIAEEEKEQDVEIIPEFQKPETPEIKNVVPDPEIASQTPGTEISFEPFHTVDYFASQGIRLSQEEVPKDKFGKQLKSFTDWLKTMKRLPANQVARLDTTSEKKVSHLAEDSVHNSDVITEAMAEVWLKQGNYEKAIETYNKLSLLNPSKKAYFATLIENLKRS